MKDRIKKLFAKSCGVNILSQAGYEKPVRFDNPSLLNVKTRQAKLWKANDGILKRVDCILYTVTYNEQVYAEYESEQRVLLEIKRLAEVAQNGDIDIFKFSYESELSE